MKQALATVAGHLTGTADALSPCWPQIRYQHVAALRALLRDSYAPATANKMLCAIRGVLREAWRLGLIPEEAFRKAIDVKGIPGTSLPPGRALAKDELRRIISACLDDGSAAGVRDAAMVLLMYCSGLRRSEVSGLSIGDLRNQSGELVVRRGKGHKDRTIPVAGRALQAVDAWLAVRGIAHGPLFSPVDKAGKIGSARLSTQAVYNALLKRCAQAGVGNVSPHDLRRSMISHLLDAGADLVTVSKLAGHSSVTTTARYDRRGEDTKRRAIRLIDIGL